jgi:outer membrane protein assembly factor BamB
METKVTKERHQNHASPCFFVSFVSFCSNPFLEERSMRLESVLAACFCLSLCGTAPAQNWPRFRGPNGDGVAAESKHPDTWSSDEHLAWKMKLPGVGWSQPIVWEDKVFVTTAVSDKGQRPKPGDWSPGEGGVLTMVFGNYRRPPAVEYEWKVLCLDAKSGEVLWERTAYKGRPRVPIHVNNTYATETPATDGERLVVYFGMVGVYCYDLAGKPLWSKDVGSYPLQMDWGSGSSPILVGDLVIIQCDNDKSSLLVALNKTSGDEVWRAGRDEKSNWCTPVVWKNEERTELIVGGGSKMRSYDPASGKLLWEMAGSGRCAVSPVAGGDHLYVDSGDRLTGQRGILAAIKPGASGDISVTAPGATNDFVAWSQDLIGHCVASPLVTSDCLYLCEQKAGIIHCLNAKTGKRHFRQRLPGATGLTASPWTMDGKVFFLDQSGQTFVLAPGPQYKLLATNKLPDEMFWASAAVAGDSLFLRGVDHLYCIR